MTLGLPAVGVQKAMTTQHNGNVNSSSAGFQSMAGSEGGYLWGIHRANPDSLPSTLGLLIPRLCICPSSCSIETCFKMEAGVGGLVWNVFMSAYLHSCTPFGIHYGGPQGVEAKGRGNKGKSMRRPIGVTMRKKISPSDVNGWQEALWEPLQINNVCLPWSCTVALSQCPKISVQTHWSHDRKPNIEPTLQYSRFTF